MFTFNQRFRKTQQLIRFKPTESQMNPNTINILSIDGGGFRSIISLVFLMELELRSKRNISAMFNMVGGTSFGSIIAACLTYPTILNKRKPKFLTRDIISRWNNTVPKIYSNDHSLLVSGYRGYMYTIEFFANLAGHPKYDGENRKKVL